MVTEAERETFIREGQRVIMLGEMWYDKLKSELEAKYPAGHFVIINVENGEYVVDEYQLVAEEKASKAFPRTARRFVRKIVGPYPHTSFAGCMR